MSKKFSKSDQELQLAYRRRHTRITVTILPASQREYTGVNELELRVTNNGYQTSVMTFLEEELPALEKAIVDAHEKLKARKLRKARCIPVS